MGFTCHEPRICDERSLKPLVLFAELIVADATLKEASSKEEKISLLDTKLQNATAMFLNIHARFIFENKFYQTRQDHVLSVDEITELMLEAREEAYQGTLASYHPHFGQVNYISLLTTYRFITSLIHLATYSVWESMHTLNNRG